MSQTPEDASTGVDIVRSDLFSLTNIPGKGKGLIATQSIEPGTCLISEKPLFTTADIQSSDVERELVRIVKALPKDSQRAFLSLHNNSPGREPFSNIVRSNGYPLGPTSDVGGIFPNIARINHSCRANTQQAWNASRGQETAYSVRKIQQGEEITIAYTIGGPSKERKAKLKNFFGFVCSCELCSLPPDELDESDARHTKAAKLDEAIGDPKRVKMLPERALHDCHELLGIYEKEGISDTRVARLYYDAFQICLMHSDQARAKVFAKKCAEARSICEGLDSTETAEMNGYAEDPSSHSSFGGTTKWKSTIDAMPRLSDVEQDKWLWRR